jgi:hypothetical protein
VWVCKEHLDVAVNWKGKGCRKCDARKQKQKKKVEEEDNTKAI